MKVCQNWLSYSIDSIWLKFSFSQIFLKYTNTHTCIYQKSLTKNQFQIKLNPLLNTGKTTSFILSYSYRYFLNTRS